MSTSILRVFIVCVIRSLGKYQQQIVGLRTWTCFLWKCRNANE